MVGDRGDRETDCPDDPTGRWYRHQTRAALRVLGGLSRGQTTAETSQQLLALSVQRMSEPCSRLTEPRRRMLRSPFVAQALALPDLAELGLCGVAQDIDGVCAGWSLGRFDHGGWRPTRDARWHGPKGRLTHRASAGVGRMPSCFRTHGRPLVGASSRFASTCVGKTTAGCFCNGDAIQQRSETRRAARGAARWRRCAGYGRNNRSSNAGVGKPSAASPTLIW
jgi:hypothetical protein